jgi:hypothetical protein
MSDEIKNKRGRKPKSKENYFGINEEDAIKKYLSLGKLVKDKTTIDGYRWECTLEEDFERNKIYNNTLKPALTKLIDSIIRTYNLYSKEYDFNDLHHDTLSFLATKFHKFDINLNKKAYSYYGTACKRYLISKLLKETRNIKNNVSYEDISSILEEDERYSYTIDETNRDSSFIIKKLILNIETELQKTLKNKKEGKKINSNELIVDGALLSVMSNWEVLFKKEIHNNKYNKNIILYYMREMTNLNTKEIRNCLKKYKELYNSLNH